MGSSSKMLMQQPLLLMGCARASFARFLGIQKGLVTIGDNKITFSTPFPLTYSTRRSSYPRLQTNEDDLQRCPESNNSQLSHTLASVTCQLQAEQAL
jgi:hypothetical protein